MHALPYTGWQSVNSRRHEQCLTRYGVNYLLYWLSDAARAITDALPPLLTPVRAATMMATRQNMQRRRQRVDVPCMHHHTPAGGQSLVVGNAQRRLDMVLIIGYTAR